MYQELKNKNKRLLYLAISLITALIFITGTFQAPLYPVTADDGESANVTQDEPVIAEDEESENVTPEEPLPDEGESVPDEGGASTNLTEDEALPPENQELSVNYDNEFGFDDLANGADVIVSGTVTEKSSFWNDEHTGIFTTVVLDVEDTLKGTLVSGTVTVIYQGGEVDGMWQWDSAMPALNLGEKTVVFLKNASDEQILQVIGRTQSSENHFEIYGGYQGKFTINGDQAVAISFSELKLRIEKVIEGLTISVQEQEIPSSPVTFPYSLSGYSWAHPPDPVVSVYINENTPDCTGEGSATQAAAATWSAAGAKFSFRYAGSTGASARYGNYINEVMWTSLSTGIIARTTVWGYGSTIDECDLEFNDNYLWSTAATPPGDRFDVQTIALHEFGHFLCLLDLFNDEDSDKVMYGYGFTGENQRTLHADDIAGIRAIYGSSITAPAVTNSNGATNLSSTTARLNGNLTSTGGQNPTVHIYWGDNDGGTTAGNWNHDVNLGTKSAGTFYTDISGLMPHTTYYYRCYAINTVGGSWASSTATFITYGTLNINIIGSGTTVPAAGLHSYAHGSVINLTATPASGYMFANWSGDTDTIVNINDPTTNITMNGNYTITANFKKPVLTMATTTGGSVTPAAGPHTYDYGSVVNITAAPESDFMFVNWTGDVSTVADVNSSNATVIMNGDYTITGNFKKPVLDLRIVGSGNITPEIGLYTYDRGSVVNLTATPAEGWWFDGWTGDVGTVDNVTLESTTVTMNGDYIITAVFDRPELMMAVIGSGNVTPGIGTHPYDIGTVVDISADASTNWMFTNWTGDVLDNTSPNTTITLLTDETVTANFTRTHGTVTLTISGNGTASISPVSENNSTYATGTIVSLNAIAGQGWRFAGWTGDVSDLDNSALASTNMTIDNDYNITAVFNRPVLNMTIKGNGSTDPEVGTHPYDLGSTVNITATPATGWSFIDWTGDVDTVADTNSASTNITMNDDYSITATFQGPSSWLSGWDNRFQVTIDSTNINETLIHFPVLVHLSASSGQAEQDITRVFDEVGSNSLKIAATKDDGKTQLYIEVEKWDAANKDAWLWISKSDWTISSSVDTTFYLYYDNTHADNSEYVGLIGSTPAKNVWDSNFVSVWHMKDGANSSQIIDSKGNYTGTKSPGSGAPTQMGDGKVGYAQDFNQSNNEYITAGLNPKNYNLMTMMVLFKTSAHGYLAGGYHTSAYGNLYQLSSYTRYVYRDSSTTCDTIYANYPGAYNVDRLITINRDKSGSGMHVEIWLDDVLKTEKDDTKDANDWYGSLTIGGGQESGNLVIPISGYISEFWFSNTVRSDAWNKATYQNCWDNLIAFSEKETPAYDLTISSTSGGSVTTPGEGTFYDYPPGTIVNLLAVANSGYKFVNWTGDVAHPNYTSTNITMDTDKIVTANFEIIQQGGGGGGGGGVDAGGGGGGGGSGGANGKTTTSLRGSSSSTGVVWANIQAVSMDTKTTLDIPYGTKCTNANGNALTSVTITELSQPDAAQSGVTLVGTEYELGPNGASFDPPITLTIKYNESSLPADIPESALSIAIWDTESKTYKKVECKVDTEANKITASISHFSRYTIISSPRPAAFTLSGLSVSPANVKVGDTVNISITVSNTGDVSGDYTCSVSVNGVTKASRSVTVGAGTQTNVNFSVTAEGSGPCTVSIGSLSGKYNIMSSPASFKVDSLAITPAEVDIGGKTTVSVTVTNTGRTAGTYQVNLNINGKIVDTKEISLSGGASQQVSFTITGDTPGKKLIDVNGQIGGLVVRGEVPPPEQIPLPLQESPNPTVTTPSGPIAAIPVGNTTTPGTNWGLIFGIISGVVLVTLGILYLTLWRKRSSKAA